MRVLVVEGYLVPEQMAHWFAARDRGVDLHFACAPGTSGEEGSDLDMDIHLFRPRGWVRRGHLWWWYPGLASLVEDLEPDIIHVTAETYGLTFSQLDLRRDRVVGHVVDNLWTHGNLLEREIRLRRASRILGQLAGVASWNQAGLDLALEYGLPPTVPTTIVPGRIAAPAPFEEAASRREENRERWGFGSRPVAGFLGRLVPEKGVDWLFESWAGSEAARSCDLAVFGSGRMEEQLHQVAEALAIDVRFMGAVAPADVPDVMAALDLLVVPSLTAPAWAEQFGRVIVEAMFAGTPVIASDSGSIPEVVGEGGILVPEGDRDALRQSLDTVMGNGDRRASLGKAGRVWALEHYSPETLGSKLFEFWNAVGS